jgi:hypothetical protein
MKWIVLLTRLALEWPALRRDIKEMKTLKTALMPECLESVITAQEATDLLTRMTGR